VSIFERYPSNASFYPTTLASCCSEIKKYIGVFIGTIPCSTVLAFSNY